ncbi:hypothetical protein GCM10010191_35840 [Actinomadura vinacea]|uniref:Uncharacterized protein n=1 Tax=Actinomadura vinacea TaxID=115336 RepID=A0ABN3J3E0_9ACTN
MTAVLLVGDLPNTGIIPDQVAPRIADSATPEAALAFVDGMAADLRRHGAALVVCPAWRSDSALKLVRFARGLLDTDRIALVPLDLPPLALSLVVDQLTFMAPHVRSGVLVSVAQVLADRLYAGAWVSSVAKLEHVRTGLGQHMASLMPGSGFMVAAGRSPRVQRVTTAKPLLDISHRPIDPVLVLAVHENGDVDWLQNRLKPELRAVSLTFVADQPLSSRYWGSKKYAEFVAFSGNPRDLQLALETPKYRPCPWCEEPTALPACPFCHRAQPPSPEPQAPHQVAAETPGAGLPSGPGGNVPGAFPVPAGHQPAAQVPRHQAPPSRPPVQVPQGPVPVPLAAPTPSPDGPPPVPGAPQTRPQSFGGFQGPGAKPRPQDPSPAPAPRPDGDGRTPETVFPTTGPVDSTEPAPPNGAGTVEFRSARNR